MTRASIADATRRALADTAATVALLEWHADLLWYAKRMEHRRAVEAVAMALHPDLRGEAARRRTAELLLSVA